LPITFLALLLLTCLPGSIAEGPPQVEITSEGGLISGDYQLNATVTGDLQAGEVYFGVDDDDPSTKMTDKGGGDFQAIIDVTILAEGPHTLFIKAINSTGSSITVSLDVDVDRNSPRVILTSKGGMASGGFLVTATVSDPYLNESAVYCVVDDDLEASRGNVLTRVDGDNFEITIDTTTYPDGGHSIRVWAFDIWGSYNKSQGDGMDVDNTPPVIEITSDGGVVSGTYVLWATVTDANLFGPSVNVTVGSEDPLGMTEEGEAWSWIVDTIAHPNGDLVLKVEASDISGYTASTEITITVKNLADLVVTDVEWSADAVDKGRVLEALVTVRNDGSLNASGFKVVMVEDGEILVTTVATEPLDPGASSSYPLVWTTKGSGKRTLSIQVDPDDTVEELNEDDNTWSQTHEVKIEEQEESPGPGVVLAMSALALTMLAARRRRG
jgi:MYXO-CTERM domain-containing protein